MNKSIDLGTAVEMALKAISNKPEGYKYRDNPLADQFKTGCKNVLRGDNGENVPGCIIGTMVIEYGEPIENIRDGLANLAYNEFMDDLGFEPTYVAKRYMHFLQMQQDEGNSWSDSHAYALSHTLVSDYTIQFLTREELIWLNVR